MINDFIYKMNENKGELKFLIIYEVIIYFFGYNVVALEKER